MGTRESIAGIRPFAEISRGQVTIVFKGHDHALDRFVLLKVLRPEFAREARLRESFANEARLLAKIKHPNVVSVFTSGIEDGTGYIVTEFVEGVSLGDLLTEHVPPPEIAAFILRQTAAGLGAAHSAGVVHRDIKPENILISTSGEVKVTDFGLAIAAESATDQKPLIAGTLGFVAPEVIAGESPTPGSDLFSLGAAFYQCLTGQSAFSGDTDGDIIDATLNRNPMQRVDEFANSPAGLLVICGRLLRKRPGDRPATCNELVRDIDRWLQESNTHVSNSDLARYIGDPVRYASFSQLATVRVRSSKSIAPATTADGKATKTAPPAGRRRPAWLMAAAAVALVLAGTLVLVPEKAAVDDNETRENPPADSTRPQDIASRVLTSDSDAIDGDTETSDPKKLTPAGNVAGEFNSPPPSSSRSPGDQSRLAMTVASGQAAVAGEVDPDKAISETPFVAHRRDTETDFRTDDLPDDSTDSSAGPAEGTITITTVPWASVSIDGINYGSSFPDTIALAAGVHSLRFKNPDLPEMEREVRVAGGQHQDVSVSLWAGVARLSLTVVPWAIVEIDGVVLDTIPPQTRPIVLTPGTHRLKLVHPELGQITRDVFLEAGEQRSLAYNLRQASAQ